MVYSCRCSDHNVILYSSIILPVIVILSSLHIQAHRSADRIKITTERIELSLEKQCKCFVSSGYITSGALYCDFDDSTSVLFLGRIFGNEQFTSTERLDHMQDWVSTAPVISVEGTLLTIASNCDVKSEMYGTKKINCSQPSTSSAVIAGVTVSLLLIVIAVIAGFVTSFLAFKRYKRKVKKNTK